jgi:adenine/guanine phosphoribosyltransferase-like PRPP-binding protein
VVDDLITTGAHFVAVRNMLRREFPDIKIVGLFIARRVPEAIDIEDFDLI